jgi:ketosteroid isomerase-like protein
MAALEPHLQGAARARAVFDRVRNGDDSVADLYAEDGVVFAGSRRVQGRETIRAFYRTTMASIHPQPEVQAVLESPDSTFFAVVLEVPTDQGHAHALDLFTIDDEGIRQLEIFSRPIG